MMLLAPFDKGVARVAGDYLRTLATHPIRVMRKPGSFPPRPGPRVLDLRSLVKIISRRVRFLIDFSELRGYPQILWISLWRMP